MSYLNGNTLTFKILVFYFILLLCGCKQKLNYQSELSFYYWKQKFMLSQIENAKLEELKVKKLYIKMFDLTCDHETGLILPVAVVQISDALNFRTHDVIPCVFIENRVFQVSEETHIDTLAFKIMYKIKGLIGDKFREVHIDCDWTKSTKVSYFNFLKELSRISGKEISCTIRLHQIKYAASTGVPPVSKGVLMCYNMGVIQNPNESNSIFDLDLVKNYTKNIKNYPLKLDVALPIFGWNVVFREDKFIFIVSTPLSSSQKQKFELVSGNSYKCISGTKLGGKAILKGDLVREEAPSQEELKESMLLFSQLLDKPSFIFYHLNKPNLEKYEKVIDFCAGN